MRQKKKKLRALSPRANYTDQVNAANRRSWQILGIEGCRVEARWIPYGRNLGFLDQSRYVSFK
jgi:hypothetical protein